jgi:hypothetical protein
VFLNSPNHNIEEKYACVEKNIYLVCKYLMLMKILIATMIL